MKPRNEINGTPSLQVKDQTTVQDYSNSTRHPFFPPAEPSLDTVNSLSLAHNSLGSLTSKELKKVFAAIPTSIKSLNLDLSKKEEESDSENKPPVSSF